MGETPPASDSLSTLWENLRHAPFMAWRSYWRRPATASARGRSGAVVQSLFLHIHSARIHRFSLKPGFTAGLGVATLAFFAGAGGLGEQIFADINFKSNVVAAGGLAVALAAVLDG